MKDLSTSLHYAVELLSVMSAIKKKEKDDRRPISLREVATLNDTMSLHFLEQIARRLRLSEILQVVRGPGGGYVLRQDTLDKITIKDLMGANILRHTSQEKEIPPFSISKSLETTYADCIKSFNETKLVDIKGFGKI